ncbi:hypothetical protein ADK78_03155 [Kitasatospora aureofaciens]|nr:hypothetical protein ADK78_03155 [Kitasatospora aureofaciens]KOT25869.1 hypothetical protein ADK84_41960 [Streptomyces sp. NRRL WC-3701]KOT63977.1 hypothetical protein ADK44_10040 [Streptomyces rimosus subsp. rimosus]QDA10377.1 hypothetical protein CTZ40_42230 [Streptomyces rimosus]KOT71768.1 hypothetical protein ADK45_03265 [Streptomyces rimosus subsp. rimosus]
MVSGFQVTGFALRINREIDVSGKGDITWLPPADILNLLSIVITMLGVFIAPVLDIGSSTLPVKAFGLAVLLLAGYPFALAGHYDMFNSRTHRSWTYFPGQERIALSVVGVSAVAYITLAAFR